MKFDFEETMTHADWAAWVTANAFHSPFMRAVLLGSVAVQRLAGVLLVPAGVLLVLISLLTRRAGLLTALGAVLVLVGLSLRGAPAEPGPALYKKYAKRLRGRIPDTRLRLSFGEDRLDILEDGAAAALPYTALTAVWADSGHFYLFLEGKMRFILRKNLLSPDQRETFPAFLEEKTGTRVERIELK